MADTYHTILSVAKTLFIKQGYTATPMRQIAETVGIGKATIYHHFPDKQAILLTLVEENIQRMYAALAAVQAELDPRERFRIAALDSIRYLYESADLLQIARRESPGAREKILVGFRSIYQQYIRLLKEALQKGVEMKIFRPVNTEDAAQAFMTMIQGSFATVYITGIRPEAPEKAAARLLDIFFYGINAEPESGQ
jgi:AcrR family transcriptional regulator